LALSGLGRRSRTATLSAMSEQTPSTPASWYPDPMGRHELRYFDGSQWTDHVSSSGNQGVDPVGGGGVSAATANKVDKQLAKAGVTAGVAQGGGSMFTEPVLIVNQKAKLIEITNEYAVFDQHGTQLGAVREVGQTALKKAARVLTSLDQFMTHSLQIVDMNSVVQLTVTRPAKLFKSKFVIGDGAGAEVGHIVQKNVFGKIRFSFESGGREIGSMNAENWRAWNFSIKDESGTEVARITKTWEGLGKALFTSADNYVVQMHRPLEEPLRSLVVAAALSVDTALKQDNRGFN
jgi:uncharacterized protein YxjI